MPSGLTSTAFSSSTITSCSAVVAPAASSSMTSTSSTVVVLSACSSCMCSLIYRPKHRESNCLFLFNLKVKILAGSSIRKYFPSSPREAVAFFVTRSGAISYTKAEKITLIFTRKVPRKNDVLLILAGMGEDFQVLTRYPHPLKYFLSQVQMREKRGVTWGMPSHNATWGCVPIPPTTHRICAAEHLPANTAHVGNTLLFLLLLLLLLTLTQAAAWVYQLQRTR